MAAAAARFSSTQRRILVVDDDHSICELVSEMLSMHGYDLECVASDRAAHQRLTSDRTLDAVILDVNLGPGVTGFDLARYARTLRSDFPVIYISGQASHGNFKTYGVPGSTFVEKPFTVDELIDAVEIALADD